MDSDLVLLRLNSVLQGDGDTASVNPQADAQRFQGALLRTPDQCNEPQSAVVRSRLHGDPLFPGEVVANEFLTPGLDRLYITAQPNIRRTESTDRKAVA